MEELEVGEEVWGPARGLWRRILPEAGSCRQDGGAEGRGGDLDTGEGFVWVSPARACRAEWRGPK